MRKSARKKRILFFCTGNSCRSQIAEAFAKHYHGEWLEAYSAGTSPQGVDPKAVKSMKEVGIDISNNKSKSLEIFDDMEFDFVITLCDGVALRCPMFPAKTLYTHVPFDDPPILAIDAITEDEVMKPYRRIRDEIAEFVKTLPQFLKKKGL